jgi:hypothetical protein
MSSKLPVAKEGTSSSGEELYEALKRLETGLGTAEDVQIIREKLSELEQTISLLREELLEERVIRFAEMELSAERQGWILS